MLIKYFAGNHGAFKHTGLRRTWFKAWVGETSDMSYTFALALSPATWSHDVIIANCSLDHNKRETFLVNRMMSGMGNGWGYRHFTKLVLVDVFLLQTTHHSDSSPNGVWLAPTDSDTMKTECSHAGLQTGQAGPSWPFIYLLSLLGPSNPQDGCR